MAFLREVNTHGVKVKKMLQDFNKLEPINVVEFSDGLAIYDGHHRLLTAWALGKTKLKLII